MTDNQVKVNAGRKTVNYIVKVAILAALSAVIMLLEFPLPFAPGFYKLDLSEAVILMGGFAMGPVAVSSRIFSPDARSSCQRRSSTNTIKL